MRWLLTIILAMSAASAFAEAEFLDTFLKHYSVAENSKLAEKSCGICHVSDSDFAFNPYGKDIKKAMETAGAKAVTDAVLASTDTLDSDGDGTSNADEIKADTGPGDPAVGGKAGVTPAPPAASTEQKASSFPPKNGFHPAIVHLPIGLFIAALVFDLIGIIRKDRNFMFAGWYNMVGAALTSLGGIMSGLLAMTLKKLPYRGLIFEHILYAVACTIILWVLVAMRVHRHDHMNVGGRIVYYVLALGGLFAMSYAGHLGGIFVYGE